MCFFWKTGQSITIEPIVEYAGNDAVYFWRIDGKTVGRDKTYTYEAGNDSFTFYIDFSITTDYGSDELEIQVDIVSLLSPKFYWRFRKKGILFL